MNKTCTKCKETKDISMFYRSKTHKGGHSVWCKECTYKNARKWFQTDKGKLREKSSGKNYRARIRGEVIAFLGGKCTKCGFSDHRALQVDHVNNGGSILRKTTAVSKFYLEILAGTHPHPVQLLCANCNWIKRYENKENHEN